MPNFLIALFLIQGLTGKIQGVVLDKETKEPISYADVIILNTEMGAASDNQGNFYILNVPPGRYDIEVSFIGYQTAVIRDVKVEIDRTARLKVELKKTIIELPPLVVTGEMPVVKKDMVGTTYIVRKSEILTIPIDYSMDIIAFQPSVARADTAIHVRGGRATEVLYMIDNVPILDPQTGDPAINVSKGAVNQVIFLPGGFDVEYGRAMSGIINLITEHPSAQINGRLFGKTERIMPFYYDFGYENYQSSFHIPLTRKLKTYFSLDLMHTDDWDPRLYILPHKRRDDYTVYGKLLYTPTGKLNFGFSGAKSRSQFDRYNSKWKYNIDNYRSDMRKGDLEALNINFLPNSRNLFNLTVSRLYTRRLFGVREAGGQFEDFTFRDYANLEWPHGGIDNPFGINIPYIPFVGDYDQYQDKSSQVLRANFNTDLQIHQYHELRTGFEYNLMEIKNFTYFISDTMHQLIDEYNHHPKEYAIFVQDNIDYKGLFAKIGVRYDYFSSDIEGIKPKISISPRLGFSFMVTEKFLFRANVGQYTQPPLYDQMYSYYNLLPFPAYITQIPLIGNPALGPEKTIAIEIGLQGEVKKDLLITVNTFYKDISDLLGTKLVQTLPRDYVTYFNVEYANVKGLEAILEFQNSLFSGKVSYTLSWARGTSSYAEEVYYRYYYDNPDTSFVPPTQEYYLDFDQRHRIFIQGSSRLPLGGKLDIFAFFGNGFPYTPPGPEGKYEERNIVRLPFQRQIDCAISRAFKIHQTTINFYLEVINLLDERYEIAPHYPIIALEDINMKDFEHPPPYIDIMENSAYYNPAGDRNHDGLITPYEEYLAMHEFARDSDDWVNAYTAPRRARIGINIVLK
ncbi:hypothetical protein BXT86_00325 [candidate division WOR-3 bacterium 4484_100]|uniref:TonB-dependent receptor-like beta-barrel domain-containing protein n=1 Tax=candidate division WOR-3 bacterium 4484_100 TaxID=1936077 RepID=A0A1V4QHX3_UNCW3|nr:MAG: hypothetical protein BXT86_00325 [candidate division WOR-3 bacterium 4484_100]